MTRSFITGIGQIKPTATPVVIFASFPLRSRKNIGRGGTTMTTTTMTATEIATKIVTTRVIANSHGSHKIAHYMGRTWD